MGCVPSAERGEIVAIELLRHNDFKTNAAAYLQFGNLKSHSKLPAERNQNWERAMPTFETFLQEALDIRNDNRGVWGTATKLEAKLGQERDDATDAVGTGTATPDGWLARANAAMGEHGLEVVIHAKNGPQGHCLIGILDPANPEPVVIQHRGTGCCGL